MDTAKNKQLSEAPGRVVVDSRGRNVWQWSGDQLDSTTVMLQRLDNAALALEPTGSVRRPEIDAADSAEPDARRDASRTRPRRSRTAESSGDLSVEQTFTVKLGGGFDPYNNG